MSSSNNIITLVGNVVGGKSIHFTKAKGKKQAFLRFTLAVNDFYVDSSGDRQDVDPIFIDIKAFGKLAENTHKSVEKGSYVLVKGRLESWASYVVFLGEDNREEVKDARKKKEDIEPEDLEFGDDDSIGLVSQFSVMASNIAVNLNAATAEVEKNDRDDDDDDEEEKTSSSRRRKSRRSKADEADEDADEAGEDDDEDEEEDEPKPKRRRSAASSRRRSKAADDEADEDDDDEAEAKPRTRRRRPKAAPKSDNDF